MTGSLCVFWNYETGKNVALQAVIVTIGLTAAMMWWAKQKRFSFYGKEGWFYVAGLTVTISMLFSWMFQSTLVDFAVNIITGLYFGAVLLINLNTIFHKDDFFVDRYMVDALSIYSKILVI